MSRFKMKPLLFLIAAFFLACVQPAAANPMQQCRVQNPAWYQCTQDTDCKMISNPCGAVSDAARADKADEVETCNRHAGATIGCVLPDIYMQGKTFHAACVDGQCRGVLEQPAE